MAPVVKTIEVTYCTDYVVKIDKDNNVTTNVINRD